MVAQDCARAYRANSVLTASPGQLVLLLFDGALSALARAREAFDRPAVDFKRYEDINKHLRHARRIIAELQGSLKPEEGEEFAKLMLSLYDYYNRRLHEANLSKKVEPVIEVERLLGEVRDAWAKMLKCPQGTASAELAEPAMAR
jgi:flagellar protein FliS